MMAVGLALLLPTLSHAEDIPAALPDTVELNRCRIVSVSEEEIGRQWKLYFSHAKELRGHDLYTDRERVGLAQNRLTTEFAQCFTGSKVYSAMCFAKASNETLRIQSIKLFSGASSEVCMVIANTTRK